MKHIIPHRLCHLALALALALAFSTLNCQLATANCSKAQHIDTGVTPVNCQLSPDSGVMPVNCQLSIVNCQLSFDRLLLSDSSAKDNMKAISRLRNEKTISDQCVAELFGYYPTTPAKVKAIISAQRADGTWPDINYQGKKLSGWEPKEHLDRVLKLCRVWRLSQDHFNAQHIDTGVTPAQQNRSGLRPATVNSQLSTVHRALAAWFRMNLRCGNWWYRDIGVPLTLGNIAILFRQQLTPEERQQVLTTLRAVKIERTGQNKVWLAGNVLRRALLEGDTVLLRQSRDAIASEIRIGAEEGLQSDGSFRQHGPQQQWGNYGASYLSSLAFYARLFAGTAFDFSPAQRRLLDHLILQGYRHILWRGWMDVNALDRQLFHDASRHKALSVLLSSRWLREGCPPEDAAAIDSFLTDNLYPSATTDFTGQKYFPKVDETLHRRPQWYCSVKMASDRVIGVENVNDDNRLGFCMADGATYCYLRGDEYNNVFPLWDWHKVPGTTSYDTRRPVPDTASHAKQARNHSSFVGAATDGHTGITAEILRKDGITARKAWVMTDDFVLCLGAGICSDSVLPLATTIDQRSPRGPVQILKGQTWQTVTDTMTFAGPSPRIYCDSVCYLPLAADQTVVVSTVATGDWHDCILMYPPQRVSGRMMTLYVKHPARQAASYQYLLVPAVSRSEAAAFQPTGLTVLRNDSDQQCVLYRGAYYIAAYRATTFSLPGRTQKLGLPSGLYLITPSMTTWVLRKFDPHTEQQSIVAISRTDE